MLSDKYDVKYIRGILFWVACGVVVDFPDTSEIHVPVRTWHVVG